MSATPSPSNETLAEFNTLTRYQDEFLRGDKRYLGFISGVGAGKTYAGIVRTLLNMELWNPGEMGAIVAPTRQMVVNVIIPEMRDFGLLDKWEYNSTYSDEPGIHAPNGSRALILSADNERTIERLRGLNLSWGWVDEEAVVDPRARDILMQRLRTGEYRNMFLTTTPKGRNHTYDFFVGDVDAEERSFGAATVYETDDRLAIVGVPTSANEHLPEDYQEAMAADLPDEIRAQEVEGRFVEVGGGVFSKAMLEFARPSDMPDVNYRYVIGVDVAVEADAQRAQERDTDYWAAVLLAVHPFHDYAYAVDARRERGLTLKQGVEWVKSIAGGVPNPTVAVESNQSQRWLKQELADAGLNATAVMNQTNKEDRLIQMSIPLERGTVRFLNQDMDESLGYDPRWQDLIGELLSFPEGAHDDLMDGLHIAIDNAGIMTGGNILGADPYESDEDE